VCELVDILNHNLRGDKMKKVIRGNTIYFYDDNDSEIMYIGNAGADYVWFFNSSDVIKITQDMELYSLLEEFMKQEYVFSDTVLKKYKDKERLIWYSDCYYDPDDEWSVDSVSCLNIQQEGNSYNIWCSRALDKKINNTSNSYCIGFSPAGNGQHSKNLNTGFTLQDDFITYIYNQFLKTKNKKLKNKL